MRRAISVDTAFIAFGLSSTSSATLAPSSKRTSTHSPYRVIASSG
jgi:hypothetical protein